MHLSPEETKALLGACGVAAAYLRGTRPTADALEALKYDHLQPFLSTCEKLRDEALKLEQGMARPLSDKIYVHAALTPEAHRVLHETLARRFNGKVPAGAIGAYLSDLILDDIGEDTTGDVE